MSFVCSYQVLTCCYQNANKEQCAISRAAIQVHSQRRSTSVKIDWDQCRAKLRVFNAMMQ